MQSPHPTGRVEATRLSELSSEQWRSGVAAWLGWTFDGLELHLYTLVAAPFVAQLLGVGVRDDAVGEKSSWIQAAFLVGWALGGGLFGRVGDRIGRCRALALTVLVYAAFTGLSFFAQTWQHLLVCRFVAALGIGGEWAVGASLLSETWPKKWRHWIAAVLQTGVNIGILVASGGVYLLLTVFEFPHRSVFLIGVLPALLVLWIRTSVSEPAEWTSAKDSAHGDAPRFTDLFRGSIRRTTIVAILVCATSLTAHWAFMFWFAQHLQNLPDVAAWSDGQKAELKAGALSVIMVASICGNFAAAAMARRLGYRLAVILLFLGYFASMSLGYYVPREHGEMWLWLGLVGLCQGVFALFTMYLPPLFPTLLRTTGAGFCYNIGRLAAAVGTVYFGAFSKGGDFRMTLLYASFLFLPAAIFALWLPELPQEEPASEPVRSAGGAGAKLPAAAGG